MLQPLLIVVDRKNVEAGDIQETLVPLQHLISTPEIARTFKEQMELLFHGYDEDSRELWEIEEVRRFVFLLDEQFPYWLYFMAKSGLSLGAILRCFLPPFLTEEGRRDIFPGRTMEILEKRWGPALMQVSAFAGMTQAEAEQALMRSAAYFAEGRLY